MDRTVSDAVATPVDLAADDARIYGVVEGIRRDRVIGWAVDRKDPGASVEIEVLVDGEVVQTGRAERYRKDLEKGGIGTGRYGFSLPFDGGIEPGFEFTVAVRARAGDGTIGELSRSKSADPDPDRRLLERLFEEVRGLRAAVDASIKAPAAQALSAAALAAELERVTVVQARLERTLSDLGALGGERPATGVAVITWVVGLVATASLGLGIYSMWLAP